MNTSNFLSSNVSAVEPAPPAEPRGGPGSTSRRRSERRPVRHPARLEPHATVGSVQRHATLLDASATGLCLLCDAVCAPGERIVVHLPYLPAEGDATGSEEVATVQCAVRTCRVRSDGLFRVGVELIDAQWEQPRGSALARSVDGITGWVGSACGDRRTSDDTPASQSPPAARRAERRGADGRATIYACRGRHRGPEETVGVVDLSEGGIAVLRAAPLEVGDRFVARVPREDAPPLTRLCRVASVTRVGRRYRIGATFVPSPAGFGGGWLGWLLDWLA